jgi:hypothetical protein
MAPKPKSVPRYRLHKASGQAIVTLSGHDHYLGPFRSRESKQKYDRFVAEWLARGRRAPQSDSTVELTVVEVLAAFKRHAEVYRKNGRPTRTANHFRPIYVLIRSTLWPRASRFFRPASAKGSAGKARRARCIQVVHQRLHQAHQASLQMGCFGGTCAA